MKDKRIAVRISSPKRRSFNRKHSLSVRFSQKELEMLRAASEYLDLPVSDIIRRGAMGFSRSQLDAAANI